MSENEHERFERYYVEQMNPRWERMKQIKELERTYDIENVGTWENCRLLYNNSTLSFVYGNYFASIATIGSAIEAYLYSKIPGSYWREEFNPKQFKKLSLGWLIDIAEKKEVISEKMAIELDLFASTIRNNVIHPRTPMGLNMLGFTMNSLSSFISPTGEPILPTTPYESALQGFTLFIRMVREILK